MRGAPVGSLKHPRTYDPAIMAIIKGAFHDVWQILEGDLIRDPTHDQELKAAIIRRLLDLVENGITSQEELRAQLLRNLPLG